MNCNCVNRQFLTGNRSHFVACPKGDARNMAHLILFDADAMLQREELNSILDKLKIGNIPNLDLVAYIHKKQHVIWNYTGVI